MNLSRGNRSCCGEHICCHAAYSEVERIVTAMQRVLAQDFVHELIVVDDHSQDGTAELAESTDDARVRLIRQPVNRGKAQRCAPGLPPR